jgi:hypothetical protein
VVEKIKDKKGEFWCDFTNVGKLNGPHFQCRPPSYNGGGDPQGLVSVVKYALNKYNGDASKASACGLSSSNDNKRSPSYLH